MAIIYYLTQIDAFFWGYIGFLLIVIAGLYFTIKSNFFQFRILFNLRRVFKELYQTIDANCPGSSPIRLYFASVTGMAGLGNIVAVITALTVGGPGAVFWLWIAGFAGMLIKYSEIYLGIRYRKLNKVGGYDGGPMYYVPQAFNTPWIKKFLAISVSALLCIYGVEIYQFLIIADTVSTTFNCDKRVIVLILLAMTMYASCGGIKRLVNVTSILGPLFIITYFIICMWVLIVHCAELPEVLHTIIKSAFNGHAALGGFAGSTFIMAAQQGTARAVYSADIAIGYDSIIQSETKVLNPALQARLTIFSVFTDMVFCTLSLLVVMVTHLWILTPEQLGTTIYVMKAFETVLPHYIDYYMAAFIFLAGWTTIIAFLAVGFKSAYFISPRYGKKVYTIYAVTSFYIFSFCNQSTLQLMMSLCGGLLVLINLTSILRLRKHIRFE